MQAMLRIGMSASLAPRVMLRSLMRKTGKSARMKSVRAEMVLMT